jgi:transposase
MWIIGCDLHARYQQIAALDKATGEMMERRLEHDGNQTREFYTALPRPARVGIEASGTGRWFERLLAELGHELWVGDPAEIQAAAVRSQKTDARDAQLLLRLLLEDRFPRVWVPSPEERDARQLLVYRNKLVSMRTGIRNQLHALAMNQGLRRQGRLWSARGRRELEALPLDHWASEQRRDLSAMLDSLDIRIKALDQEATAEAERRPEARRLMQQPGVGPVTALAFVLTIGPVSRFRRSKQVVSYLGLNPREHSSGGRQRLGAISKQGNTFMRWLLVEAGGIAARYDPELHRDYLRLKYRRGTGVARIAIARKLAVRLFRMLRTAAVPTQRVSQQGGPDRLMVDGSSPRF